MGTDIHSMLEIKTGDYEGPDGDEYVVRWRRNTAAIFRYPYFREDAPISTGNVPFVPDPLRSRNYRLFAILADVRNGSGFAGVDTGDRVEPIAEPRGVPEDASPEWKAEVEAWDVDMHSTSYFTLAELEAYDWDATVVERSYISEEDYLTIQGTTNPPPGSTWGGAWGQNLVSMTAAEYDVLSPEVIKELHDRGKRIDVQVEWTETRRENMGELAEVMEVMRNSAPRIWDPVAKTHLPPDPTAIRIVFGFDN